MLCLVAGSRVNQQSILVHRPLGAFGGSPARHRPSGLMWSGNDDLVRGTWRPPSFVEKLLSGKRDQGDRDCIHRRDLIAGSNTLRESFDNVDVSVPLWLTEPQDKSSSREFASSHTAFMFPHFILAIFMCHYFHRVVS